MTLGVTLLISKSSELMSAKSSISGSRQISRSCPMRTTLPWSGRSIQSTRASTCLLVGFFNFIIYWCRNSASSIFFQKISKPQFWTVQESHIRNLASFSSISFRMSNCVGSLPSITYSSPDLRTPLQFRWYFCRSGWVELRSSSCCLHRASSRTLSSACWWSKRSADSGRSDERLIPRHIDPSIVLNDHIHEVLELYTEEWSLSILTFCAISKSLSRSQLWLSLPALFNERAHFISWSWAESSPHFMPYLPHLTPTYLATHSLVSRRTALHQRTPPSMINFKANRG